MSLLAALLYYLFARTRWTPLGIVAALISPSEWTKRVGHGIALALAQLPATFTAVALMRPSLSPLRIVSEDGAVDPYGGFAEPGSKGRFMAKNIPPHLFPAGFGPSRWCATPTPTISAAAEAKDAIAHLTMFFAHVVSGAASCVALRRGATAGDAPAERLVQAARFGAVLGAIVAAHFAGTGARNCAYSPVQRPRLMRIKRSVIGMILSVWPYGGMAVWFSLATAGAHAALHVAFTWRGKIAAADGMLGVFFVVFNFWCAELGAAARLVPAGFACAAGWLAARAASNVVLTERYKFLPQSLGDGPVSASAPLLASLAADSTPFAQHAAYADLCAICEDGGGGRRSLLLADKRGDAYAPAMAAALAPVIAVTCAMRAALDAAERADRGIVGGKGLRASGAKTGGGVKLRVHTSGKASAVNDPGMNGSMTNPVHHAQTPMHTPGGVAGGVGHTSDTSRTRDVAASAGDLAGAAAWSMIADEWGVSPSVAPAPVHTGGVRVVNAHGLNTHASTENTAVRPSFGEVPGDANRDQTMTARQLRHQLLGPVVAASDECVASLAAHGQLAAWGARAAAALAGVDARGDPNGVANARAPTAAHSVRVLLAACHAARECERAGSGGNKGVGRGASSSRGTAPRVPQLAAAVGPAAALADAFQTAFFKLVSRYGNDAIRSMAAGDPELKSSSGMNGVDDVAASGEDAAAGLVGLTGAARREGEIAHGLRAPAELERTLETLLKWE